MKGCSNGSVGENFVHDTAIGDLWMEGRTGTGEICITPVGRGLIFNQERGMRMREMEEKIGN